MSRLAAVAVLALLLVACSDDGSSGTAPSTSPHSTSDTAVEGPVQLPPVLEIPTGVTPCRADELEVLPSADAPDFGASLIHIANRSGGPCGLAGFLTVVGQDAEGEWHATPTTPIPRAAVDGDRWTGVFDPDPGVSVVISIRPSSVTDCQAPVAPAHYTGLRLVLPGEAGAIDSEGFEFDVGGCPLEVTAIAGDSGDF